MKLNTGAGNVKIDSYNTYLTCKRRAWRERQKQGLARHQAKALALVLESAAGPLYSALARRKKSEAENG
jgi:hypothetical protein